jgi:hydroxymethylpyrimidine pyrophosphatase-like HAD family hydrolase
MEASIYEDAIKLLALAPETVKLTFCGDGRDFDLKANEYTPEKARAGMPPDELFKVVAHLESDDCDAIMKRVCDAFSSKYGIYRSWYFGIELQSLNDSKGQGILRLKKYLGDRIKTVIACGDYENDLSMIEAADIGYAVGDAIELLKQAADRITVNCADHALAAIVRDIEADVKSRG